MTDPVDPPPSYATAKLPYLRLQLVLHDKPSAHPSVAGADELELVFADFKFELENGDDVGECLHDMANELLGVLRKNWPANSKTRVIIGAAPLRLVK